MPARGLMPVALHRARTQSMVAPTAAAVGGATVKSPSRLMPILPLLTPPTCPAVTTGGAMPATGGTWNTGLPTGVPPRPW